MNFSSPSVIETPAKLNIVGVNVQALSIAALIGLFQSLAVLEFELLRGRNRVEIDVRRSYLTHVLLWIVRGASWSRQYFNITKAFLRLVCHTWTDTVLLTVPERCLMRAKEKAYFPESASEAGRSIATVKHCCQESGLDITKIFLGARCRPGYQTIGRGPHYRRLWTPSTFSLVTQRASIHCNIVVYVRIRLGLGALCFALPLLLAFSPTLFMGSNNFTITITSTAFSFSDVFAAGRYKGDELLAMENICRAYPDDSAVKSTYWDADDVRSMARSPLATSVREVASKFSYHEIRVSFPGEPIACRRTASAYSMYPYDPNGSACTVKRLQFPVKAGTLRAPARTVSMGSRASGQARSCLENRVVQRMGRPMIYKGATRRTPPPQFRLRDYGQVTESCDRCQLRATRRCCEVGVARVVRVPADRGPLVIEEGCRSYLAAVTVGSTFQLFPRELQHSSYFVRVSQYISWIEYHVWNVTTSNLIRGYKLAPRPPQPPHSPPHPHLAPHSARRALQSARHAPSTPILHLPTLLPPPLIILLHNEL
ncbi:hypothetical protein PR048_005819 [Dryococelus australis]|uniref:Peptidase S1 domain-containing protein n=1 Tax=Dryococelus australis TaxID=614101 RepID=A0ABQ9I9A2_9NEOP|nr:hypothetical protein PR048_005819 [Dryococelus australis]